METSGVVMEPDVNDIILKPVRMNAQTICQGVDGSIFCSNGGKLYRKIPDDEEFTIICAIDDNRDANILGFDHGGNLYYAGIGDGQLKRSRDYGKTFNVCIKDGGAHSFRGFAIDKSGSIYVGSYGKYGPASLYCSRDDGATWSAIKTFRCRHIHAVGVNPATSWLYVVTGEMLDAQKIDAYGLFRSKDGGQTWTRIVEPVIQKPNGWGRPLYLSIGFLGDRIILGTDHFEGNNGLDSFIDDGRENPFTPARVFSYPESECAEFCDAPIDRQRYCWGFINWGEHIYTIASGKLDSILYRSSDGINWQKCATFPAKAAWAPEISPWADKFFISVPNRESYAVLPAAPGQPAGNVANPHSFWTRTLIDLDQRYGDDANLVHCRGYYSWSIVDTEKQELILKILQEYNVPKDGAIADVGCGVGTALLTARNAGYTGFVGIEANPRWLIGARTLYEASFPGESPALHLIPRGSVSLPKFPDGYAAILIVGVFGGNGNNVPPEQALKEAYAGLKKGGLLYIDVEKIFMGDDTLDIFLKLLAKIGFTRMRCRPFRKFHAITALKE